MATNVKDNREKTREEFIAEFMGAKSKNYSKGGLNLDGYWGFESKENFFVKLFLPDSYIHYTKMKFESSWDWIMPVVDKIGELGYRVTIGTTFTRIWVSETKEIEYRNLYSSLAATFLAVVEFIKWYNKNVKER